MDDVLLIEGLPPFENPNKTAEVAATPVSLLDTAVEPMVADAPVSIGTFSDESIQALGDSVSVLSFGLLKSLTEKAEERAKRIASINMTAEEEAAELGLGPLQGRHDHGPLPVELQESSTLGPMDEARFDKQAEDAEITAEYQQSVEADSQIEAQQRALAEQRFVGAIHSEQVRVSIEAGSSRSAVAIRREAVMETVEGEVVVERTVGDDAPGAFRLSSEYAAADSTNTDKELSLIHI